MLHLWIVLQLTGVSEVFAGVPADPRFERLQAWMTAVERHPPGSIDGPAAVLRWWDRTALADIHDDMFALSTLIADRGARRLQVRLKGRRGTVTARAGYMAGT